MLLKNHKELIQNSTYEILKNSVIQCQKTTKKMYSEEDEGIDEEEEFIKKRWQFSNTEILPNSEHALEKKKKLMEQ